MTLGPLHKHLHEGMHRVCVCCRTSQVRPYIRDACNTEVHTAVISFKAIKDLFAYLTLLKVAVKKKGSAPATAPGSALQERRRACGADTPLLLTYSPAVTHLSSPSSA